MEKLGKMGENGGGLEKEVKVMVVVVVVKVMV